MSESPDGKLALSRQPLGEQTKHHTLAGAWVAADEREAAFAHQAVLDAPAEAVDPAGLQQCLGGQFGRERVEFKGRRGRATFGSRRRILVLGQIGRRQTGGSELGHELVQKRRDLIARRWRGCRRGLAQAALAGSVGRFVEGVEWTQDGAAARVHQIDVGEIPAGVPQARVLEMGKLRWNLEAAPFERNGAVGPTLGALDFPAESLAQDLRSRTLAADVGPGTITFERRAAELGVACLMVLALDPGVGCVVESIEGELAYAFQHGDQPAFEVTPYTLLLPILPRRKRQSCLMQNPEGVQAILKLVGHHGCAIVGQQRSWQGAPHQRLAEAMNQASDRLIQEPLHMADQPGAVIENAQRRGFDPGTHGGQHVARPDVKVEVPTGVHVLDFKTPDFAGSKLFSGLHTALLVKSL